MASEVRVDDGAGADGAGKTAGNRVPKKQCVFKGKCNALAVQLFAIDDKYETRCNILKKKLLSVVVVVVVVVVAGQ